MKQFITKVRQVASFYAGEIAALPSRLSQAIRYRGQETAVFANAELGPGTHETSLTRLTDAAITTRHLLYKLGSDNDHIAVCAATADHPLGVVNDEADAAEEPVNLILLGLGPQTVKMVASEAITIGDELYTTATGKVQDRPSGAGTYWHVGYCIGSPASADGDVIEAVTCVPSQLVIP